MVQELASHCYWDRERELLAIYGRTSIRFISRDGIDEVPRKRFAGIMRNGINHQELLDLKSKHNDLESENGGNEQNFTPWDQVKFFRIRGNTLCYQLKNRNVSIIIPNHFLFKNMECFKSSIWKN